MAQFSVNHCGNGTIGGPPLATVRARAHLGAMLNILSGLIGLFALLLMIPTIVPLLGWANWLFVPIALLGAFVGMLSSRTGGRNFCLVVAALGMLRLYLGGGII